MNLSDSIRRFYESMSTERERSLDRLGEFFAADIRFVDPFRETHGLDAFRELFVRMFRQYPIVAFTGFRCEGDAQSFTLVYDMHLRMRVGPTFSTPMASVFRVRDGKVV